MSRDALFRIVVVLALASGGTVRAADRDTLKGIHALDVLIEDLAPEAERDGLTTTQMRGEIESQLRQAGINLSEDATETFYVNVNAHPTSQPDGRYMYNIEMRVSQPVVVLRTNNVAMAATWSRAIIGTSPATALPGAVRADLRDLLTTFLIDYSAANPSPDPAGAK